MTLLDSLAARSLVVVTGKGGVGKTTVSAALGRVLVDHGRRVLLLDSDPRESLYRLLDVSPSGGDFVAAGPGLFLQNLRPRDVVDRLVRDRLKIPMIVDRLIESQIYRHFVDGAPGMRETALLGHAMEVVLGRAGRGAPDVDVVVLDAPATGHGVSMLAAPLRVSEAIAEGPIHHLVGEVAEFLKDPARTSAVAVTLAEEMPVQETVELAASMAERLGRGPALAVVNALYPACEELPSEGDRSPALALWRDRCAAQRRELDRFARAWPGPRIDLPLIPDHEGWRRVAALAERLAAALAAIEATP